MQTQRLFIAIEFSPEIIQGLTRVIQFYQQQNMNGVRWVHANNLHLTLRFLGDTSAIQSVEIQKLLQNECGRFSKFSLIVKGSGAFPSFKRPNILWVGIHADETLFELQKNIECGCRQIGFKAEERPFSPHLTIGRLAQNASIEEQSQITDILKNNEVRSLGSCIIKHVILFKSDLTRSGPIYSPLGRYLLTD